MKIKKKIFNMLLETRKILKIQENYFIQMGEKINLTSKIKKKFSLLIAIKILNQRNGKKKISENIIWKLWFIFIKLLIKNRKLFEL